MGWRRLGARPLAAVFVAVASALFILQAPVARADAGELTAAGRLGLVGVAAPAVDAAVQAEWGLSPSWAGLVEVGGDLPLRSAVGRHGSGRLVVGGSWLYDVLVWVPFVSLAAGVQLHPNGARPLALARAGLRTFRSPRLHWAATLGVVGHPDGLFPELAVQLGWLCAP